VIGGQTANLVGALPWRLSRLNTVARSLIRNPNGKDTNDAASDWAFTAKTTEAQRDAVGHQGRPGARRLFKQNPSFS
jgi:hypothetical protein